MIKKFLVIGILIISLPVFCMVQKNDISSFSKSLVKACNTGNINEAIAILKQNRWENVFKIFGLNKNKMAKSLDIHSLFGRLFDLNLNTILHSETKRQLVLPFLNAKDNNGKTFLIEACEKEIYKLVATLLECGVDINAQDVSGCTALTKALKMGKKDIIELLLTKGAIEGISDDESNESVINNNLHQNKFIGVNVEEDDTEEIGDIEDLPMETQTSQESVLFDLVNECEDVFITNERDGETIEIAKVKVFDVEKNYTGQDDLGILLIVDCKKESIDKIFCLSSNLQASSLDIDLYIKDEFDNMAFIDTFKDYNENGLYLFLEKGPDVNFLHSSGKTVSIVAKKTDKDKVFNLLNKNANNNGNLNAENKSASKEEKIIPKLCRDSKSVKKINAKDNCPVLSTSEFVNLHLCKCQNSDKEENGAKFIGRAPEDDDGISTDTDEENLYDENNLSIDLNETNNLNESSGSEKAIVEDSENLQMSDISEKLMDFERQFDAHNAPNAADINSIDEFNFVVQTRNNQENQSEIESETESDPEFAIHFATDEEIARVKNLSSQANTKQNKKVTQCAKRKTPDSNIQLKGPAKKIRNKKSSGKKYKCEQCDKEYSDYTGLNRHIQGIHGDGFDCKICNKKIGTYGQLRHHQMKFHKKS